MTVYEIRKQALEREESRALRIAEAMEGLPTRKTRELSLTCTMLSQAHRTLCAYDLMSAPPAIAGITETWFDAALERVVEIKRELKAEG